MDFNSFIYFVLYSLHMKVLLVILTLPFLSFAQATPKKDQLKAKRICANAVTLFNEGQSSNAYMLLKQAVALDPNNANAFYWLAATEYDLRSYNYAKEHSDQALKLLSSAADQGYRSCCRNSRSYSCGLGVCRSVWGRED